MQLWKGISVNPPLGSLLRLGLAHSGQQSNNLVPFVILCLVSFAPALVFASFRTISQILCLLLVALLLLDISVRHNEFRKTSQKKTPLILSPKLEGGKGGAPLPKLILPYAIPLSIFTECQLRFNVNVYTNLMQLTPGVHFFCSLSQWYNDITWQGFIQIEKYDCELDFGQCQICNQVVLALSCNQCVFYGRAISCAVLHHLPHESSKPNLSEKIDLSTTRAPIPFSLWVRADERMNEWPRSIFFCT